jgi:hypothetical protein
MFFYKKSTKTYSLIEDIQHQECQMTVYVIIVIKGPRPRFFLIKSLRRVPNKR